MVRDKDNGINRQPIAVNTAILERYLRQILLLYLYMIRISILALKNAVVASIADSQYLFNQVNRFLTERGKKPLFQIQLVGNSQEIKFNNGTIILKPDKLLRDAEETNLIIVPALTGDMSIATMINIECAQWMAEQYKEGAEIASLCTGAFLVAFSGILKGKECTTHWEYANELKFYFPSIHVVDERMITGQDGLYSSGGSNAYWNLLLYLVEKYAGREMAIYAAKYFVIDMDKDIQSPFTVFHGMKTHKDERIKDVQAYIEKHFREKLMVDYLSEKFNMSRRTFERRFKKATRHTVTEYVQRVKIEGAKAQLEIGRKTIS